MGGDKTAIIFRALAPYLVFGFAILLVAGLLFYIYARTRKARTFVRVVDGILGSIFVVYIIVVVFIIQPWSVRVPSLIGKPLSRAKVGIQNLGFSAKFRSVYSNEASGEILDQFPRAKTKRVIGSFIELTISRGKPSVPRIIRQPEATAKARLGKVTLTALVVKKKRYDNKIPKGWVVSQKPEPGARVPVHSQVRLTLSLGKPMVPDLKGKSREQAAKALSESTLIPDVREAHSPSAPRGYVIGQDIPAGSTVDVKTKVGVEISKGPTPPSPLDITTAFYPSGWMGDGEQGTRYINLDTASRVTYHSSPSAVKVTYQPGPTGWAGIFWQYPDSNWGDKPGRNLTGYTQLTFWAKGEKGGEIVEFKAGDIRDFSKPYQDSFAASLSKITLSPAWKQYQINLTGTDLSNVIGAFAWVATGDENPGGVVFYLDDLYYNSP